MNASSRLRIATRIHFALLRHYGADVEVGALLKNEATAREALWVCDASGDAEMVTLARQFRHVTRAEAKAAARTRPAATPQDLAWSRNTSGFGLSHPVELESAPSGFGSSSWLKPSTWLKGRSERPAR